MHRIARRSAAMILMVLLLIGGISFFMVDYFLHGENWVMKEGSPHVFDGPNIGCGIVTDRDGLLLLDTNEDRLYSKDALIRTSTLHWVGDRYGNISAPAVATYAKEMAGYDPITGLYSYSGAGKTMLTLSAKVQNVALEAMGDKKGVVAVYNYKTGEILCTVSTPTFDPENPPAITEENQQAYEGVYMNRFTMSAYVPGSIFKVITTAAALEEIPDIREQTFTCTGTRPYHPQPVTCSKAHGELDLDSALAQSCNCTFAAIVDQLGPERLKYYVEKYAVTQPVSFDGVKTAAGNFDLTDAGKNQIAWSGIGQHKDQINPCAYLTFMGAVANGGAGVLPHVVSQVTCGDAVTYQANPVMGERIMPEEIAAEVQRMMRNNVVEKYGVENFPDLTVCAKSGTAQADNRDSTGLFAGFVTDEEYPLAFIAIVEEGGYGREACVPIVSQVLSACKEVMDQE